ncbi:hypothetical protein HQ487_05035 [Candidatus Uhrbacteria bacterium]|nr:hypothetical protein [Candidatus Uhrbacteria bacterium]
MKGYRDLVDQATIESDILPVGQRDWTLMVHIIYAGSTPEIRARVTQVQIAIAVDLQRRGAEVERSKSSNPQRDRIRIQT